MLIQAEEGRHQQSENGSRWDIYQPLLVLNVGNGWQWGLLG